MKQSFKKQILNSDKMTEIKYPEGDKVFIACSSAKSCGGCVLELSMISKDAVWYDLPNNYAYLITSMAKKPDNKS